MYSFTGRYDGLDRSSSKRILIGSTTLSIIMMLLMGPILVFQDEEPLKSIVTSSSTFYVLQIILFIFSLYLTFKVMRKLSGEDNRVPELTIFNDGIFKYKKFHKNKVDFTTHKFENFNLKVIENENKTLLVETAEGEKFVIYKQYNGTKRTIQNLSKDFPNQHYPVALKWFELEYDRKFKKLILVLHYCSDMNRRGAFDMNKHEIF